LLKTSLEIRWKMDTLLMQKLFSFKKIVWTFDIDLITNEFDDMKECKCVSKPELTLSEPKLISKDL
jgi:hypothetical protein